MTICWLDRCVEKFYSLICSKYSSKYIYWGFCFSCKHALERERPMGIFKIWNSHQILKKLNLGGGGENFPPNQICFERWGFDRIICVSVSDHLGCCFYFKPWLSNDQLMCPLKVSVLSLWVIYIYYLLRIFWVFWLVKSRRWNIRHYESFRRILKNNITR